MSRSKAEEAQEPFHRVFAEVALEQTGDFQWEMPMVAAALV